MNVLNGRMEQTTASRLENPMKEVESETEPDGGNALQIPDGGWGWVVCFAGFMINFTNVGLVTSHGIILLGLIDLYDVTISKTAMVGSLFMGMSMCAGPLVLLLMMFNASHRQVIICGGFLSAVSTIASVFAKQVEVLYVTYGILSGCSAGMSYFAGSTIVGSYFKKKRTLAVGIANSGSGGGAFALNYLIERSISFYGMRGTFLLISGLFLNFVVYGALCRPLKTVNMKKKKMEEISLISVLQTETNSGFELDEKRTENKEETNGIESKMNKRDVRVTMLSELKLGHCAAEATRNINSSSERTVRRWFPNSLLVIWISKILLTVWWCINRVIHHILLQPGQTITAESYCRDLELMHYIALTNNSGDSEHPGYSDKGSPTSMTNKSASKCSYLRLAIFDPDVLKNSSMQLLLTIYLFGAVGKMVLVYLPAKAVNVGLNREQAALVMSIYGVVFAFSQIVVGILADLLHIPTSYLLMSSLLGMSAIATAFTFCRSFSLFVLCASLFAICKGFSSALRVVFVASILGGKNLTKGYSPLCLLIGLAYIIYPIITGFSTALRVVFVASILGVKNLTKGYSPLCLLIGLAYIIFAIITGALFDATQSFDAIIFFATACLCMACITSSGIVYMQLKKKFYE